jgi:hypothetical protein
VPGLILAITALILALIPAVVFFVNLRFYRPPPAAPDPLQPMPAVSVLIPARDEELSIGQAVEAVLSSRGVTLEVLVLDDHSHDATAAVVANAALKVARLRLLTAPPLPSGWWGKQHACAVLAEAASHALLVFVDADVRLAPAGLAQLAAFLESSRADLVSGVPRQETGSLIERLVIPLIHFLLLSFLPLWRMRESRNPAYAAGCGQLFMARRSAYLKAGGHGAIRTSLHDGLTLPRAFRAAGLATDLCDATAVASCRMYRSAGELWHGLSKNAHEGLAAPRLIVPATGLLFGGQVLPFLLLGAYHWLNPPALACALGACAAAWAPRFTSVWRFRQSLLGAALHPVGIFLLLALTWSAFIRRALGRSSTWKGRIYPASTTLPNRDG